MEKSELAGKRLWLMASSGQTATQCPQAMQLCALTTWGGLPFSIAANTSAGQASTQLPQRIHKSGEISIRVGMD